MRLTPLLLALASTALALPLPQDSSTPLDSPGATVDGLTATALDPNSLNPLGLPIAPLQSKPVKSPLALGKVVDGSVASVPLVGNGFNLGTGSLGHRRSSPISSAVEGVIRKVKGLDTVYTTVDGGEIIV